MADPSNMHLTHASETRRKLPFFGGRSFRVSRPLGHCRIGGFPPFWRGRRPGAASAVDASAVSRQPSTRQPSAVSRRRVGLARRQPSTRQPSAVSRRRVSRRRVSRQPSAVSRAKPKKPPDSVPGGFLVSAFRGPFDQPKNTTPRGADAQTPQHNAIFA